MRRQPTYGLVSIIESSRKAKQLVKQNSMTTINITHCARCNEDHKAVDIKPFTQMVEIAEDEFYNFWAMCPKLNEPILVTVMTTK